MNKALIQGAALSAPKFQNYSILPNQEVTRQMQLRRMYQDRNVRRYIDNLPPGADIDKLPASMQQPVQMFLTDKRRQYGMLARQLARPGLQAGSPRYMQMQAEMNKTANEIKNLSNQLDNFKALKTEFLEDFDEGIVSNGSDTSQLKELFSTDEYKIDLTSGSLKFLLEDGTEINGANLPKYFNRNASAVDGLLKLNQQAYKSAMPIMDKTSDYLYRRQVTQLVTQGGRDGLLSLATDKFLDNPMIDVDNIDDPNAYLLKEENHKQLQDFVINNWMQGISSAAQSAYNMKKRANNPMSGINLQNAMEVWNSGDLSQITNMLPLNSKISVVPYDDGTYDLKMGNRVVREGIDPGEPRHLNLFLEVLGIPGGNNSIDLSKI